MDENKTAAQEVSFILYSGGRKIQNLLNHLAGFALSSEDGVAEREGRVVLPTAMAWKSIP